MGRDDSPSAQDGPWGNRNSPELLESEPRGQDASSEPGGRKIFLPRPTSVSDKFSASLDPRSRLRSPIPKLITHDNCAVGRKQGTPLPIPRQGEAFTMLPTPVTAAPDVCHYAYGELGGMGDINSEALWPR
jgi:hypothetical protein